MDKYELRDAKYFQGKPRDRLARELAVMLREVGVGPG